MGERLTSWRHDLRETFFSASEKHLIKKPGEAAAVCSACCCCMARQMLKYTVGHVCCICGFFLSLPAAKYLCALVPQDTSDLYQQTVCVCVYCVSVSLWTNMNSGSPPAFMDMETKWQKYWRTYQFICLYLHRPSLCLCLSRSISLSVHMNSESLGLLKDAGLTCQVSHLWRMCCWCLWCLSDCAGLVLTEWKAGLVKVCKMYLLRSDSVCERVYACVRVCITCVFLSPFSSLPSVNSAQTCHIANTGSTWFIRLVIQHLRWSCCARTCWYP